MTFNIGYRSARNPAGTWAERRPLVKQAVREWLPDVLGVQEAMEAQVLELKRDLPAYGVVIGRRTGRSKLPLWAATLTPALIGGAWAARRFGRDTKTRAASTALLAGAGLPLAAAAAGWRENGSALVHGAFCPIFYRRDRLRVVETADIFLSDRLRDPATLLLGTWIHRVANQVRFERISDRRQFTVFNVFLDGTAVLAERSLKKLRAAADEEWDGQPQIVLGDFPADRESSREGSLGAPGRRAYDPPGFEGLAAKDEDLGSRTSQLLGRPEVKVSRAITLAGGAGAGAAWEPLPVVVDCLLEPRRPTRHGTEREARRPGSAADALCRLP